MKDTNRISYFASRISRRLWVVALALATIMIISTFSFVDIGIAEAAPPTKVGHEFRVNRRTTNNQCCSSTAGLTDGGFVVVWMSNLQGGSKYNVYGQRYDANGKRVGGEFRVKATTTHSQDHADVAGLRDGGFVVVWHAYPPGSVWHPSPHGSVFGQRYDQSGTPVGGEFLVDAGHASDPSITRLTNGEFVIAWGVLTSTTYDIYAQRYKNSGAPVGGKLHVNTNSPAVSPSVTGLPDGSFVVTWNDIEVRGQRYSAVGSKVGGEFTINNSKIDSNKPAIAGSTDGGFFVAWGARNDGWWRVYGRHFAADGVATAPQFLISRTLPGDELNDAGGASVTSLKDGSYVVSWWGDDLSATGILGRRYSAAGDPLNKQFVINTYIPGFQYGSSVAALKDGGFIATWWSLNQDGSEYGVYGQRYSAPVDDYAALTSAAKQGSNLRTIRR